MGFCGNLARPMSGIKFMLTGARNRRVRRSIFVAFGFCLSWCAALGCVVDPLTAPSPFRTSLVALETLATRGPAKYAVPQAEAVKRPDGLAISGETLWIWSRASRVVEAISLAPSTYLKRLAPTTTNGGVRRCLPAREDKGNGIDCLGTNGTAVHISRPGAVQAAIWLSSLPKHGGYRDFLRNDDGTRVWLIDTVNHRLRLVDASGAQLGERALTNAYQLGDAGTDHLFVLRWTAPRLLLIPRSLKGDSLPVPLLAPVRHAAFDPFAKRLWTVGPQQAHVRRTGGPMTHLRTHVLGFDLAKLIAGHKVPTMTYDLGVLGYVDGVHISLDGAGQPLVAASGSDTIWRLGAPQAVATTGAQPTAVVVVPTRLGSGLAWTNRLDGTVTVAPPIQPSKTVQLSPPMGHDSDVVMGERLYYNAALWKHSPSDAYTCNTCHWNTGSDHRRHPGFLERRWEITRPLDGIAMVAPIFSTGGAPTLSDAIEGLVRGLDRRMWDGSDHGEWWLEPKRLHPPTGASPQTPASIEARQVRRSLLAFVAQIPVRRAPIAPADATAGWALFERHCLGCHEASQNMRFRDAVKPENVLTRLRQGPLSFGNPGWAKTGVEPYFTPYGNRISPLVHLSRGGPFFTNGSAETLNDVLGSGHGLKQALSTREATQLRHFLLAL